MPSTARCWSSPTTSRSPRGCANGASCCRAAEWSPTSRRTTCWSRSSSWPSTTWNCPKASTLRGYRRPYPRDPVQQLLHRHHERVYAVAQELARDVGEVDPGVGQRGEIGGRVLGR